MSLESGTTLWRLNHELLPEPGSPIARTTIPFGGRADAAGTAAGTRGACGAASASGSAPSSAPSSGAISSVPGNSGTIPFAAAGVNACATACSRPRPPRPRPPRRRRPRPRWPSPLAGGRDRPALLAASSRAGCASNSDSEAAGASGSCELGSGYPDST